MSAKPSAEFHAQDTIVQIVATLRWPAALGVSLGSVTSGYGFTKVDPAVTIGGYRYQKFQTTRKTALNWQAGTDYELFRVAVRNTAGIGVFELTNALPGGEWFVDINYLDKTDPVFLSARNVRR